MSSIIVKVVKNGKVTQLEKRGARDGGEKLGAKLVIRDLALKRESLCTIVRNLCNATYDMA